MNKKPSLTCVSEGFCFIILVFENKKVFLGIRNTLVRFEWRISEIKPKLFNSKTISTMGESTFKGGYKFAKPNPKAKVYSSKLKSEKLPPAVDLRPYMTKVEDQGQTNSCTANAVVGAYEYLFKRFKKQSYDISRMFVYYNARAKGGGEIEDEGSVIQYAMECLKKAGACSEATWQFKKSIVNKKPHKESYSEGKKFLVDEIMSVPVKLKSFKKTLADGYPIVFGTTLYKSFDKAQEDGMVPMPSPKEAGRKSHGGHAMLCVGYSDEDKMFIVRNSWGDEWGEAGYCYIPYNYLMNEKWTGDCWIIKKNAKMPAVKKAWIKKKSSVIKPSKSGAPKKKAKVYHPSEYQDLPDNLLYADQDVLDYDDDDQAMSSIYQEYDLEEGEDDDLEDEVYEDDEEDEDEDYYSEDEEMEEEEDEEDDFDETSEGDEYEEEDDYEDEDSDEDYEESEEGDEGDEESDEDESEEEEPEEEFEEDAEEEEEPEEEEFEEEAEEEEEPEEEEFEEEAEEEEEESEEEEEK